MSNIQHFQKTYHAYICDVKTLTRLSNLLKYFVNKAERKTAKEVTVRFYSCIK
jgi:hypothetical protein